ncbi:MAG: phosphoribosylformylglycinamidine synthase subunit PurQ [Candidatus Margulisbacteria bacterium]|nr:phosphoribosylformylglycinamidine synthase subunit PurQ [Candidatus Margulisiibacteriota bacterium]
MNYGVIVFPGSNCDMDCYHAVKDELKEKVQYIWHDEGILPKGLDMIIIPGGFSYGDYLRCGAIAKFAKIMPEIIRFAKNGGYVIGICNGFQILTESGMLPGALLRNQYQKFICKNINLKVMNNKSVYTKKYKTGDILTVPIAHGEGRFFIDNDGLKELEDNEQIAFKYVDEVGSETDQANPNGSLNSIAGIFNRKKNVLGMMPHPERCNFFNKKSLQILSMN